MAEVSSQTLHIVARELAAELNEARAALEAFGEQQDNLALLRKCHEHLRSVHGALRIAEVYGAALLVEEMGQVARYLIDNFEERRHLAEGLDALMRAMVQLPTYLERVMSGGRDMALVLLPLLNDLRAVRGHALLSEGTLLLLNLSSDQQANPVAAIDGEASLTVAQWARKLRTRFQLGLLGWIKGERVDQNLEILARTAEKLEQVATTQPVFQLWWVVGAVLEGLREGGLEGSASVKRLLGQADRDMRRLYELGEVRYADSPALELLNNLLYYVARARSSGPRVAAVRASFRLNELLPADDSIDEARESLSAPSVKLMKTVAAAIKEDLGRVKDALDIFVRQGGTQVDELAPQLELLKKIADTLGVLGLGELRDKVQAEAGDLQAIVAERIAAGDDTLLRMAATLIKVEDSLDEQLVGMIVPSTGAQTTSASDTADGPDEIEFRQVTEAVLRECIVNLARIKEAVALLVEKPREAQAIDQIPQLTRGIIAGLLMLGKTRAVETMEGINRMLGRFVRSDGLTLPQEAMDRLADAVVAVEYYMETLQAGRADPWYMLDNAETCLRFLADAQPIEHVETDDSGLADPARTIVIESNAQTFALPTQHEPTAVLASMPAVSRDGSASRRPESPSELDQSALPAAIVMPREGDIDPEFLELFIEEAKDEIGHLRELFPRWDENPQDLEALINVRRSFHTLKGSGRMVGAQLIGEFAWAIENLLNRVISKTLERTPEMMSLLRESVAAVPELVEQLETARSPQLDIARLIGQANAMAGVRPGAGASRRSAAPSGAVRAVPSSAPVLPAPVAVPEEKKTPRAGMPSIAERMDPVLHDIYAKETAGHLAAIREYLAVCEPLEAPYPVTESLHRSCHTLSGTAKTAGARQGIKIAEPLNRYIRKLYDNSVGLPPAGLAILRDSVAAIQQVVDHIDEDTGFFTDQAGIVARLEALEHGLDAEISRLAEALDGTVSTPIIAGEVVPALEAPLEGAAGSLASDDDDVLDILNWSYENFPSDPDDDPDDTVSSIPADSESGSSMPAEGVPDGANTGFVDDIEVETGSQIEESVAGDDGTVIAAGIETSHVLEEAGKGTAANAAIDAISPDPQDFAAEQDFSAMDPADLEADDSNILIDETGEQEAADDPAAASAEESPQTIIVETEAWAAEFDPPELASVMRASALDAVEVSEVPDVSEAIDAAEADGIEPVATVAAIVEEEEDDFDPDIAAIFTEEAAELLEAADQSLSAWIRDRTNGALIFELKRLVHTLKGGARMAGIRAMGDLSHELETLMQRVEAKEVPAEQAVFDALQASLDELNRMRDLASDGQRCTPAHELVDRIRALAGLAPAEPAREPAPDFSPEAHAQASLAPVDAAEFEFSPASPDSLISPDSQPDGSQTDMVPTLTDPFESVEGLPESAPDAWIGDAAARDIDGWRTELPGTDTPPQTAMQIDRGEDAQASWNPEADTESGIEPAALIEPAAAAAGPGSPEVAGLAPDLPEVLPEPAPEAAVLPGREPQAQERHEVARVDADLLDNLLNNAGEVSIFRSRLEQQISSIEFNLAELGRTVTRLKEQLRKLELETEAQILHRHEAEHPGRADFDPLELDRYSSIQQLSRAFAESVSDVSSIEGLLENLTREAQNLLLQQSRVVTEMQNGLMRTRMVPFQRHVQRLSRLVRQVATETGKQAELVVTGASGELDRQVLDRMLPPFEHMLRNAVIHGIESPQERLAAGKPERGTIKVGLHREGSEMVIVLEDDGRGIDVQAVRERARLRGLLQQGRELSDEEALQLILEPGFSTASAVTQHAGRGVGMDVVVTEIKKLGGALFTRSRYGQGAQFTIRLPFTLAITQALIVRTGEELYALPLPSVEGVARVPRSKVQQHLAEDTPSFDYGGQLYRFQHLGAFVGGGASVLPEADVSVPVILIRAGEYSTAIVTDELIGSREMVVKSVGPQIATIRGIAGATILGDGRIVIILDMGSLVRSEWRGPAALNSLEAGPERRALALVVDDSITVRRVTQRLLERNGMRVMTAKDGVDALSILQEHSPDVILLDIEMPRMDGYELAAHVRADARLAAVPIVMITSRVGEKHRARAIELGVNDYLGKPYQENQLLDAIEPLISARRRRVS
ncbi:type IV pili sensor histidine kinase and response regulator [Steroidobacter denitrificans]|uniref:Chemotaxis protein CheA n=1 Tax=Steroidobacter denitrificans TaxID=465721 RepID=A0A127F5T3_STEDE|nr:Hpt domain-containing protein [Steroidobacter denitrificans]AMN45796.1 type IV pili sensor histidine kinase and response regulator [Steroidobacter denitrificans]